MLRRQLNVEQNAVDVGGRIVVKTPKSYKRHSVPFPRLLSEALAAACKGSSREDLGPLGTTCGRLASSAGLRQRLGLGLGTQLLSKMQGLHGSPLTICGTLQPRSPYRPAQTSRQYSGCSDTALRP